MSFLSKFARNRPVGFAVETQADIRRGMKEFPLLLTEEYCDNCENEVHVRAYGISRCPDCGERIIPCSMCAKCQDPCVYEGFHPRR